MIGEKSGLDKATEPMDETNKDPKDVLDEMEQEDLNRMRHLSGDQSGAIYAGLRASSTVFSKAPNRILTGYTRGMFLYRYI